MGKASPAADEHVAVTSSASGVDELVARCARGDARAWEDLVTRYERLVYAIPVRLGLGPEDAADVAQDTFVTLVRSLSELHDPGSIASWLMTVARRLSWRRLPPRDASAPSEVLHASDPTEGLVDALWVYAAVDMLEEPCATVIRSLFLDDAELSYGEVAAKLGCSVGTIGPLRLRCLSRLRTILERGAT